MRIDVRLGEPRSLRPPSPAETRQVAARPRRVVCIVGTRAGLIKMAPVIRALRPVPGLAVSVLSSGQHRDRLAPLAEWFELSIDADLQVMTQNQSLAELTARLMQGFAQRFGASRPDLVLAQGATTTVLCAALTCFYLDIPFGHVEAGLRTHQPRNPFPEEFNRVAIGRLGRLHFCPTARARDNLVAEKVGESAVLLTGNTVIDALRFTTDKLEKRPATAFDHDILLTAHRQENFGAPLGEIFRALLELCRRFPRLKVLYPVQPNPNVRGAAHRLLAGHPQIRLTEPLDYPELVAAMRAAKLVLTDSGAIQEEAPALGRPVLVLRAVTERPEAVEIGAAKLVGSSRAAIVGEASRLLLDPEHYARMTPGHSPYGDGRAAQRIRDSVCRYLRAEMALAQ
jgi:UDP-N-acetylglucosamine 2-epimerase (non-hydrolysing)